MTRLTQRPRRRRAWVLALALAFVVVIVAMLLPAAPVVVPPLEGGAPTARGAYHIHSDRSDGSGSVDQIAAAAQRAGLQFVIITDHGDGTRPPDAPQYRHGVLVIDAVELNTTKGHLVALATPVAPYPLAGTPGDVLEDVHRLGGFGIAAHPDSPRASLRWDGWETPVDGLEWLNGDSGWRDESASWLARTLLTYWFRPSGSLATLLDRPDALLTRWDEMGLAQPLPALAGADAHARLDLWQQTDPSPTSRSINVPGYESAFRAFSNHVVLEQPLTGDGVADAAAVTAAITAGRVFTVIDALASPGGFDFTAVSVTRSVGLGDAIDLTSEVRLRARVNGPPGTTLVLLRNGQAVRETPANVIDLIATDAGVYRIEAHVPGAPGTPPVPWILANPIYVGLAPRVRDRPSLGLPVARIPARTGEATIEKGATDISELVEAPLHDARDRRLAGEPPLGWRYALSTGVPAGQYAAIQLPTVGGVAGFDRVRFTVRAGAPVRAWVQLRSGRESERWGATFYADQTARIVDVRLSSFVPIGATSSATPLLDRADSLLFVIDTLNSRPGASGRMTISEVGFVR